MSTRLAPTVKQTAFRFTGDDLATFDLVQRHTGIIARTEVLRMLIRFYARAEGSRSRCPGTNVFTMSWHCTMKKTSRLGVVDTRIGGKAFPRSARRVTASRAWGSGSTLKACR
jgi:hypothetical protein